MKNIAPKTVILLLFVLWFSSCRLFFDMDCNDEYKFYLPFTLYPAQDTFHINDTIWLHANFSDELLDSNSLKHYHVENEPLYCAIYLYPLDTVLNGSSFPNFSLLVDTGDIHTSFDPGQGLRLIQYIYENKHYKFSMRLIPKITGIYWLGLAAVTNQEVDFQKKCPGELMNIYFTLNNGAENNYHFLALSPDSVVRNISQNIFTRDGSFAFRVVE